MGRGGSSSDTFIYPTKALGGMSRREVAAAQDAGLVPATPAIDRADWDEDHRRPIEADVADEILAAVRGRSPPTSSISPPTPTSSADEESAEIDTKGCLRKKKKRVRGEVSDRPRRSCSQALIRLRWRAAPRPSTDRLPFPSGNA